jgi:N utilization substance protein A
MSRLLAQEVPEIYDGIVGGEAVARPRLARQDRVMISASILGRPVAPASARGSRVQARVVNELQGEDRHHPWSPGHRDFVVNAGAGRNAKVVLDEDRERIEVVVPDQQPRSRSAGAARTCGRLAASPAGTSTSSPSRKSPERRQAEFEKRTKAFMDALNVDEVVGQLLASEGLHLGRGARLRGGKEIAGIEGFRHRHRARAADPRATPRANRRPSSTPSARSSAWKTPSRTPGVTTRVLVASARTA